ncbi:MAG: hypothetical protein GWP05_10520, partial [Anaerolineaceae bacterium]|nr:hypothetical protein [Anaerolineaceae bacterium]
MTDSDISTALTGLFNSFSELANDPQDLGLRTTVVGSGRRLADLIRSVRAGLDDLRQQSDRSVQLAVREVNRLARGIADSNAQVVSAERGQVGSAAGLRDAREGMVRQLSELVRIRTNEQSNGQLNVVVGNQSLVDGRRSRDLTTRLVGDRNLQIHEVRFADNDELLSLTGGALQGQALSRDQLLGEQIDSLDRTAQALILETNLLHAEGIGLLPPGTLRSEGFVTDAAAALNSAEAGLSSLPQHGSFLIHVTNSASGLTETTAVNVDLDGLGSDDSLSSLAAKLDAIANIDARVDATGHLVIEGAGGEVQISFTEDTSRLLAGLGVNSFFSGHDSATIGLADAVAADPGRVAAGLTDRPGDNANALRLAALGEASLESLGNSSLLQHHQMSVTRLAVSTAAARSANTATQSFLATMQDEREAVSGVNLDEEAVNLIRYQKAYVAAARFMSVMNDMLDELMDI